MNTTTNSRKLSEILEIVIPIYREQLNNNEIYSLESFITCPAMCYVVNNAWLDGKLTLEEKQNFRVWIKSILCKPSKPEYAYLGDMLKDQKKGWKPKDRLAWYERQQRNLMLKGL